MAFFYRLTQAPDVYVARVHLALRHGICGIVRSPHIYARTQTHLHASIRVGSVCLATWCVCIRAVFLLAERWYTLLTYQERKKNKKNIHLIFLALHVDAPVTSSLQTARTRVCRVCQVFPILRQPNVPTRTVKTEINQPTNQWCEG